MTTKSSPVDGSSSNDFSFTDEEVVVLDEDCFLYEFEAFSMIKHSKDDCIKGLEITMDNRVATGDPLLKFGIGGQPSELYGPWMVAAHRHCQNNHSGPSGEHVESIVYNVAVKPLNHVTVLVVEMSNVQKLTSWIRDGVSLSKKHEKENKIHCSLARASKIFRFVGVHIEGEYQSTK
ncbi:hypothetical protein V6N13_063731 [Hibiscus sabdariffa]